MAETFLILFLATFLTGLNVAIYGTAARNARRRRLMARHRMIMRVLTPVMETGQDDDPYLTPYARFMERVE